ncbi:MAG: VWA domain-containing protein [Terriglobales bacterium]
MRHPLHRLLWPLVLGITVCPHNLLFGQSAPAASESSNLTYHSSVSEVRLVFFATDEHRHAIAGLKPDDFAVIDNETVIRNFRSFAPSDLVKLDVVVLIDSSESVLPDFQQEIADVMQLISQCPWGPGDNVSAVLFGGAGANLICAGNCRSSFTADRIASLPRGGPTPLFDAVESAVNLLSQRRQPDVWPVIILFSDGADTISKTSFREALEKVLAGEVQIYAVDVNSSGWPSSGTATLQRIADDSGGRVLPIAGGAASIFTGVINDLHSASVITYVPPESSSDFHPVRILPTHNLKLQFRSRRGYYHHQAGGAP